MEPCKHCHERAAVDGGYGACSDCFDPTDEQLARANGYDTDEPFTQAERDEVAAREAWRLKQ